MDFPELAIEDKCVCPVKSCGSEFSSSSQLTMHILRHHKGCKLPVRSGEGSEHYCPVDNCSRAQGNGKPFPRLGQLKQVSDTFLMPVCLFNVTLQIQNLAMLPKLIIFVFIYFN